jgi:hypothetical protein
MGVVSFDKQVTKAYAVTLAPAGKFPIIGDRIFDTLQAAQDYVDGNGLSKTAIPGIYLSVIADGDNNGAYWVAQAAGYDGATSGILQKMGEGGGSSGGGGGEVTFSLASNTTNAVALTINGATKNITAATLKTSLGLKALAYKASLAYSEVTGKPTTLEGHGYSDAALYQNGIDTSSDYRKIGYGHASTGWYSSGPAMIFGTSAYNLALQCQINSGDAVQLYTRQKYNGVEYGWDRILTQNSLALSTYALGIRKNNPAYPLDVNGEINSSNYMAGKALSTNPTSAFISTIFDADAVSDKSYRLRLLRNVSAMDRFAPAYAPILAFKTNDTHAFISIAYNVGGMHQCYIGGGTGDAIAWTGNLFHDNMSLIPRWGDNYSLGDTTHRWKEVHAVSIKIGDAIITWDSSAGMLKADKGIYSTADIVAGK